MGTYRSGWRDLVRCDVLLTTDPPASSKDSDGFARVEQKKSRKTDAKAYESRIAELEEAAQQWADPFTANAQMRHTFRAEKYALWEKEKCDRDLRTRIGWADDRILLPPTSTEPGYTTPDIHRAWDAAQDERAAQRLSHSSGRQRLSHAKMTSSLSPSARTLAERLLASGARRSGGQKR